MPRSLAVLLLCLAGWPIPALAAVPVDNAAPNPPIPAVRVPAAPAIDGVPDEPCWRDAPVVTGFTRDTKPASVETEVRLLYDASAMYFAFTCHDPELSTIHAQQRKRNGGMGADDNVTVGIDPRFDRQTIYWFTVNALGTQAEDIPGGSASKVEWRGDWRAAARRTETGWTAEMAIPFSILRYPGGQRDFGILFGRHLPRLSEGSNWPIRTSYYVHDNEACWTGLSAPRIRRKPLVMPYMLAGSGTIESGTGADIKYTSENGTTSLLTVRPDFATIEDVVQTVDYSYNPQWLPDRRPFFTEGGGYFSSGYGFYSRSIGEREDGPVRVDAGAKAFGKLGPWTYSGMGVAWGGERDGVGYLHYDPSPSFGLWGGVIAQDNAPTFDDGGQHTGYVSNDVLHFGAKYWKPLAVNGINVSTEMYRSRTTGEGGEGHVFRAGVDRYGGDGVLEWHAGYAEVSPDYTARLAFVPEVGLRAADAWMGYEKQVNRRGIQKWSVGSGVNRTTHWDGSRWHQGVFPGVDIHFSNNTSINLDLQIEDRDDFRDRIASATFRWRRDDLYRGGGLGFRAGRLAGGPYAFGNLSQGFRFSERLSASASLDLLRLNGTLDDITTDRFILSGLYEFSDERSLAVRLILGNEDARHRDDAATPWDADRHSLRNAYAAYRQELRRGADIFILAGDPNTTGIKSQLAMKYVVTY